MRRVITEPSEALRAVARLIRYDRYRYTCDALKYLSMSALADPAAIAACTLYIQELLRSHHSLESWLLSNAPNCSSVDLFDRRGTLLVKKTRLAWLKWMAQQFEAQGR